MITVDGHIHYCLPKTAQDVIEALDQTGCDKGNLVAQIDPIRATETIDVLYAKHSASGRLYAYAALNPILYFEQEDFSNKMVEHVKDIMACGADGIKMLEGKPSERKMFPVPNFDSPLWDAYWSYVEEHEIPIVFHVNDPEEFWDELLVPDWARRSGWFYAEGDWINNEDQYRQIGNVLKRHPKLKIIFAHFYFLSKQLPRLTAIFESCPNVCVDITPGIELFENLSKNLEEAKLFFTKYQDRILYGTDISRRKGNDDQEFNMKDSYIRGKLCHEFIQNSEVFIPGDADSLLGSDDLHLNGLSMPKEICDKIFGGNFLRLTGEMKEVNPKEVLKEIEKEKERMAYLADKKSIELDLSELEFAEEYFKKFV